MFAAWNVKFYAAFETIEQGQWFEATDGDAAHPAPIPIAGQGD
jgi:hypothetical protein